MRRMVDMNLIDIAGIQLTCVKQDRDDKKDVPSFVYENGTSPYNNLQQLALAVSCNRPVLLQGPVGSGKTSTVEYLASVTGHKQVYGNENESGGGFVKVQLGEQTDSRMLLGGYQSTEIPGKFIWKPGVLTNAVVNGCWILLEDIDSASSDVVTVIDNLIKNGSLSVPGLGNNIIPHPEFQLFATQRTLGYDSHSSVKCDVLKHWFVIQLKPLNCLELVGIISKKFPLLSSIASKMVSILELEYPIQSSDRVPSARDLLKWCNRCSKYFETGKFDVSLRVFQDALDIFCGYMYKDSKQISEQIGIQLGIVKNKASFLSDRYKPNISVTEKKLIAGRITLERREFATSELTGSKNMVFSLTAPCCRLLEKIACCLDNNEPVLLVGETGCGKTTVLQYMARILGRNLIVINMNQQSDTADLVGGFKPVTFRWIMKPLCDKFESLFRKLYDAERNKDCLNKFVILFNKQNWDVLLKFISYVEQRAVSLIHFKLSKHKKGEAKHAKWVARLTEWEELGTMVKKYTKQCEVAAKSLVFSFIEGSLVKAVKRGDWVLLDEINLATSETLDCLSGLLEDSRGSLLLLEKGESKPILRDSGFRLFAAMNPATDVGKKRLPIGLRNRFTEFYIEELKDALDLYPLVETYLIELNYPTERIKKIVNFYLKIKKDSKSNILDGNGKRPHYSLRNLCRALTVASRNMCGNPPRSLYEGLNLSFLTQLDKTSYNLVHDLVCKTATGIDIRALLNQPIPKPSGKVCVKIEGFWIPVGNLQPSIPDNYILTDTVKRHLKDVIRIVSLGAGIPILLEGDTSVGKTSLINYLAKCTGNFCARVNNHEHTDIQEYIGTYVADSSGKLVFREGILCEAMRKGYWLILDELNLAPSEVLEALNRVLDDNRELYIPETHTVIKAHEKFMLFATQNPPGLYGGRKELSRAFKNRFIELQFGQIPSNELITILEKRCQMPLSYCRKMVAVMSELQLRRRGSDVFIGKSGFITLRDLFRWGERYQKAAIQEKFYDWDQHLADEGKLGILSFYQRGATFNEDHRSGRGSHSMKRHMKGRYTTIEEIKTASKMKPGKIATSFLLLAGRVRLQEESTIIEEAISKYFKRKTSPQNLFSLHENTSPVSRKILENVLTFSKSKTEFRHIVWTHSMRRLAVLVCKALEFSEPVLLVGETGCGKTTIVQILALLRQQNLYSVNCHTHSESADFLGGLRPVRQESRARGKLFEWCDGPLVQAMTSGSFFLADEISLADDSVLERLNSLLEPERTILLTEKGGELTEGDGDDHVTVAEENFQFIGTMNPGGDYGKKELSPALRNRFTEIWVEVNYNRRGDYQEIIQFNLAKPEEPLKSKVSEFMMDFMEWFQESHFGKRVVVSFRDVMTWVEFMNASSLEWFESCLHGCCLTFLDGLGCGSNLASDVESLKKFRMESLRFLADKINAIHPLPDDLLLTFHGVKFVKTDTTLGIHPFYISRGKGEASEEDNFIFNAPTTFSNTLRLLRGLQMNKAILLEGSPGVGKTSLVSSLARASGHTLTRINLSDQTDISDLFGADLPEEGATAGHFAWKDGPFLTALKNGHWILLDELNLALQSVLEGLNAVLDHRGSAYIPELNKTFYISKETKLFACQNPIKEGGNRRGLPKSLLNRFTQVYIEPLSVTDFIEILNKSFPQVATLKLEDYFVIEKMVDFNCQLWRKIREGKIGSSGGPWDFNLRDISRWVEGVVKACEQKDDGFGERIKKAIFDYANLVYLSRFRSAKDVDVVASLFESVFGFFYSRNAVSRDVFVTEESVAFGEHCLLRNVSYFHGDLNDFVIYGSGENKFGAENIFECREIVRLCHSFPRKKRIQDLRLLEKQSAILKMLSQCVEKRWLTILVGDHGTGKTCCVRVIAALANRKLRILSCNSAMDTTEIIGGFEQTDYNRHLDDIAETAKTVALTGALRLLRKKRLREALALLAKWSTYCDLPVVDVSSADGDTVSSLARRANLLDEIMTSELLAFDEELKALGEGLSEKLEHLKRKLEKEGGITSGGKFEWVDSVLIKCMVEGSWLLMEDVNLCSSAVLDRLNCLLEPNGCLPIGERGARTDGSLFVVRPHPDFRIFFTMNPKNGPISRAMRNRGVEIYLGPDIEAWPALDTLSLLSDAGVTEMAMQTALMKFESGRDSRNVSDLVANGFWAGQYVRHGFEKAEAFRKSTRQVYRITSEEMLRNVEELSLTVNSCKKYSISYARPPLSNFFVDDGYARLKQSCAFLVFLTEVLKNDRNAYEVPVEDLEYFLGSTSSFGDLTLTVADGLRYSIMYVFMLASGPSVTITSDVISNILREVERFQGKGPGLMELVETLEAAIAKEPILGELLRLPWDPRWYMDPDAVTPVKNKVVVLLKFIFLLFRESRDDLSTRPEILKNKQTITVAEYSKAVQDGFLEDSVPDFPVLSNYNVILDRFDNIVLSCANNPDVVLDDVQVSWLLNSFKWRFWLGTMANAPLLTGSKRTVNEETLSHVDMYFLWFSEFVLDYGRLIENNTATILKEKYEKFAEIVKESLHSEVSLLLLKMSTAFRRSLGQPLPDKYLPSDGTSMDLGEFSSTIYRGDEVILRTVFNNIVQSFHSCFIRRNVDEVVGDVSAVLSVVGEGMTPLKTLVEKWINGDEESRNQLSSEVMYHSLRTLNSEYEFHDSLGEREEEIYLKQALIFHRPVWTCRIVHFLFLSPEKWSMINYRNSERELNDVVVTVLPQASQVLTPGMDPRENEYAKLCAELTRVERYVKECLGTDTDDLRTLLRVKSRENLPPSEKKFFDKILAVVDALKATSVSAESGYATFGIFWILLGFLEMVMLQGTRVDPIRRKLVKGKCARADAGELQVEMKTFEINSKITGTTLQHPYLRNLRSNLESSKRKVLKYNCLEKVRRDPEKFKNLTKELDSYVDSGGQVMSLCSGSSSSTFEEGNITERDLKVLNGKARFIRSKTRHFINVLNANFVEFFGDLTYPLLAAAAQIEHGVNLISSEVLREPFSKAIPSVINEFCRFPIPEDKECRHPFHILNAVSWHPRTKKCLEKDKLLLLFASCRIKCNEWLVFRTDEKYEELIGIFTVFIEFWKREEEKRLRKEMEKESLYMKRGTKKCETRPEEEEIKEEVAQLFPTYEEDFRDSDMKGLNEESMGAIGPEHLSQLTELHMKMVKEGVTFNWLPNSESTLAEDYLGPLRLRYLVLSHVLPHISFVLEYKTDVGLLPGLLPLTHFKMRDAASSEITLFEEVDRIYDFYKDKNVDEANKCLELINELKVESTRLLEQWPDHPALVQINVLIDRIMSFPMESPVMKFLTGLEMLLESCQHWESVAHSGVSIAPHLIRLTNLIIEWRKLELQGWKNCFDVARSRMKGGASKWWYHIWCLIEEHLSEEVKSENSPTDLTNILQTVYNFIESSPLGEYERRLDILLSFHCHLLRLGPSERRDKLAVSFWNLYSFYSQYRSDVARKVESLSAPVVKKLKDYVSIAKWNDITYWSVKQAIDKSHRTLLKYIKEYEGILKQPVELRSLDSNVDFVANKKNYAIQDINKFLRPVKSNVDLKSIAKESLSVNNPDKKFEKAKKFCTDIILTAEYPNLILNVEYFSEEICKSLEHFRSLEVDRTLTKEQQKGHAKSIVHQKRRALADLFKSLQLIGLSYRTGLTMKEFGVLELCDAPPVIVSEKDNSKRLSGDDYYLKTVSRKLVLENTLLTPSKEIGPPIIERLRGYASHIMHLNKKQKLNLTKFEVAFHDLKRYLSVFGDLVSGDDVAIPDQNKFRNNLLKFRDIVSQTSYTLGQFSLILKSWPTDGDKLKKMNFLGSLTPKILISSVFEDAYLVAHQKFEEICNRIRNLTSSFDSTMSQKTVFRVKFSNESAVLCKDNFSLYTWRHVDKFNGYVKELKDVLKSISEFKLIFLNEEAGNCLVDSLTNLEKFTCDDLELPRVESAVDANESLGHYVSAIVENVLLTIQKLLVKFKGSQPSLTPQHEVADAGLADDVEEGGMGDLVDGHLSKRLVEALHSDLHDLGIDHVNKLMQCLLSHMTSLAGSGGCFIARGDGFRILCSVLPFIKQYVLVCSYFLEQQRMCFRASNKLSSILIGAFIQVAQKGFCIPPEYEEEGEGTGDQGGGGMGLGDGEGKRDVSDRIESEDQLEDAEMAGKGKEKQEDEDCDEEEKGIEMSDDFDGKAQDLQKKDGDEDEEDEEEPDVKEMGDTEEGADKLEKELWSSEDENGEEEEEKKKVEEMGGGKGKQTTEDQYAGKENDGDQEEKENDVEERNEKRKEDVDEINEQEDNSDQIDPYHGHFEPEQEPEPFDLPDNLDFDEEGDKEEEEEGGEGENPFDIDAMKEVQPPNEIDEEEGKQEKAEDEEIEKDSSDEEGDSENNRDKQDEMMEMGEEEVEKMEESDVEKEESPLDSQENKCGGEEKEEEKPIHEFEPSDDKPSSEAVQPAPESEKDELASKDQVVGNSRQQEFQTQAQEVTEKPREESKGTGQADLENMREGHEVGASNKEKLQKGQCENEKEKRKRERPGKSDTDRSLAENDVTMRKKLKTLDKLEEDKESGNNDGDDVEEEEEEMKESELYQHMKEKIEKAAEVMDAATKEQAERQPVPNKEEEEGEKIKEEDDDDDIAMDVDDEEEEKEKLEEMHPSEGHKVKSMKKVQAKEVHETEEEEDREQTEMEGENVVTMTVERGPETTYHTQRLPPEEKVHPLQEEEIHAIRDHIQKQLDSINQNEAPDKECMETWQLLNSVVEELSRDLTEQLRLILEPTKATRLKGDYRTGRRINMRKVISYIASEFRKDNIWLRRTKPWKRDHEIVLAIDDSSSMAHNNSKELAFEALALVSKALALLEAGQLGVLSFGERTNIVHRLGEPFTEETGAKLLQQFTFSQNKTLISEMLDVSSSMMTPGKTKGEVSKLLIIISDGRGVFSEGLDNVKLAVRRATETGIFLLFVIVDEPMSKDSIMDIRMPEFKAGKFLGIKSYLEEFPFPYYLILRDISALPSTLGDALRQWFQLITSTASN